MQGYVKNKCHNSKLVDLFQRARDGSSEALGDLFEGCRLYLLMVANEELGTDLAAKAGASDVVQDTFVCAQRQFDSFEGTCEAQLLAWLRTILLHRVTSLQRRYIVAEKRCVCREVSLDENGLQRVRTEMATATATPSQQAIQQEETQAVSCALQLLPAHYQQVIQLRHRENLSFEEVASRLGMSAVAARQRWARAVKQLKREIAARPAWHSAACPAQIV